jgi:hypothetical protein
MEAREAGTELAAWGLSILAGHGDGGDCGSAKLSSCYLVPVLSRTLLASLLYLPASMVVA